MATQLHFYSTNPVQFSLNTTLLTSSNCNSSFSSSFPNNPFYLSYPASLFPHPPFFPSTPFIPSHFLIAPPPSPLTLSPYHSLIPAPFIASSPSPPVSPLSLPPTCMAAWASASAFARRSRSILACSSSSSGGGEAHAAPSEPLAPRTGLLLALARTAAMPGSSEVNK